MSIIQSINEIIADYSSAQEKLSLRYKERPQPSIVVWTKPKKNYVKTNWDAALNKFARKI